jgi:hypothetical protein
MYVCIYVYMLCMHVFMYACMYVFMYVCMYSAYLTLRFVLKSAVFVSRGF